jgi:hypothetical protein
MSDRFFPCQRARLVDRRALGVTSLRADLNDKVHLAKVETTMPDDQTSP